MNRELLELDVASIRVKLRPRDDDGNLNTLEQSIKQMGLLQPILVDKDDILITGGRRLQACINNGMTKIPAFRLDIAFDDMSALAIQSDENLCRQKLSNEELEKQIQLKKSAVNGKVPADGLLGSIKKMFVKG
jgi:ParB family chromosome partitioning protein